MALTNWLNFQLSRKLQPSITATKCSCRPKRLIITYANIILICSFYSWSSKPINVDTLWSKLRIFKIIKTCLSTRIGKRGTNPPIILLLRPTLQSTRLLTATANMSVSSNLNPQTASCRCQCQSWLQCCYCCTVFMYLENTELLTTAPRLLSVRWAKILTSWPQDPFGGSSFI